MGDACGVEGPATEASAAPEAEAKSDKLARRRWAMLIQRVYQVDPLICPKCGGRMKIIAFIEARQGEVLQKILEHCGLWKPPPARPPPRPPPAGAPAGTPRRRLQARSWPVAARRYAEIPGLDGDFLEHLHREAQGEQLELPWD
jgi:hypothetical protein